MALKIRRGLAADRTSITPEIGEFLYTTDTKLLYIGDGSTAGGNLVTGGGGGGTPGGSDTQVQFNDGGSFGGEADFTYDKTTNTLTVDVVAVDDEAYDATGWNGDLSVPTKNAIRDKIESLSTGGVWVALPTMTRTDGDTFTIPDVGNAGNWDKKLDRLRVIKWTDTTVHVAIVKSASYSSDVVTVEIAGDTLDSSFTNTSGYYTTIPVKVVTFAIAGTIATGTDLSRKFYSDCAYRVLMGKANHGTAGTTNATTYDINVNGSTVFTTKLSVSSADTTGNDTSADNDVSLANEDYVTIDCDSVSTTLPIDAYIDLYLFPTNNIYL